MSSTAAIIGAGPVGLSVAILLKKMGMESLVVFEKNLKVSSHPRAHFMHMRTMEIIQEWMPQVYDTISRQRASLQQWNAFDYCISLGGTQICRQKLLPNDYMEQLQSISPAQMAHFPQNRLETALNEYAQELGIPILRGCPVMNLSAKDGGVLISYRCNGEILRWNAMNVIGADGAHSIIRQAMNVEMDGEASIQHLVNVHFTCLQVPAIIRVANSV